MRTYIVILISFLSVNLNAQTPRAGGINNSQATVQNVVHDNFVGVQSTNMNALAVYSMNTNFNYYLGLKTTDDLVQGSSNLYFTNTLARSAFSSGTGLNYSAGVFSLDSSTIGTLASVSGKFNIPTGTTLQYLRGDGSLATFPTIPSYTAGTGISLASGIFTNTAPDQTVSVTGTNGITASGTYPNFTITKKRQETYSGTTIAAGTYTVTFATAYSVAPNIQANIINGTDSQNIRTTSITTTGFTVLVRNRVDVVGLLPSWNNVSGATVDVLITEK